MGDWFFNGRLSLRFNEPKRGNRSWQSARIGKIDNLTIHWVWQRKEPQVGGYANTLNREDGEGVQGGPTYSISYFRHAVSPDHQDHNHSIFGNNWVSISYCRTLEGFHGINCELERRSRELGGLGRFIIASILIVRSGDNVLQIIANERKETRKWRLLLQGPTNSRNE